MNAPRPPTTHRLADALALPAAGALGAALRDALATAEAPALDDDGWARVDSTLGSLAVLGADGEVIAASLVHDWPGLAAALGETFMSRFPAVAALVEGQRAAEPVWTLHARHPGGRGSEGLRRLLLAMVRDLRVVPILLARQLARMRLAASLPENERRALAALTRDIHAPLANRLGIWQLKWELEDLAFRFLEPATYQQIARLLDEKRVAREQYIESVKSTLREALEAQGIHADVAGRPKHI